MSSSGSSLCHDQPTNDITKGKEAANNMVRIPLKKNDVVEMEIEAINQFQLLLKPNYYNVFSCVLPCSMTKRRVNQARKLQYHTYLGDFLT